MEVQNRQDWVKAIDSGLMGDLISTSLKFRDNELFEHLAKHSPVRPAINYMWLCQNGKALQFSPAVALKA